LFPFCLDFVHVFLFMHSCPSPTSVYQSLSSGEIQHISRSSSQESYGTAKHFIQHYSRSSFPLANDDCLLKLPSSQSRILVPWLLAPSSLDQQASSYQALSKAPRARPKQSRLFRKRRGAVRPLMAQRHSPTTSEPAHRASKQHCAV